MAGLPFRAGERYSAKPHNPQQGGLDVTTA